MLRKKIKQAKMHERNFITKRETAGVSWLAVKDQL